MELNPEIVEGKYYLIEGRNGSYVVPESEIGELPTGDREDLLNDLSDEEVSGLEEQLSSYTGFNSLTQVRTISLRSGVVGRLVTDWLAGPGDGKTFDNEDQATRFLDRMVYDSDYADEDEEDESEGAEDPGALTEAKLENDDRAVVIREVVPKRYYRVLYGSMQVEEADSVRNAMQAAQDFIVRGSIKDPRIYLVSKAGIERLD